MKAFNIATTTILAGAVAYVAVTAKIDHNNVVSQISDLQRELNVQSFKLEAVSDNYLSLSEVYDSQAAKLGALSDQWAVSQSKIVESMLSNVIDGEEISVLQMRIASQRIELEEVRELATLPPPQVVEPEPIAVLPEPVVVEPEPIAVLPEPVVVETVAIVCPLPTGEVSFGQYIERLKFRKAISFVASFDVQEGTVANVSFSNGVSSKLGRATAKYLTDAIPTGQDVSGCKLPFKIEV
tara:strand:+ start:716 stop:1432 length:717 start_codon:yes stop_codon:yes gene_type:complete